MNTRTLIFAALVGGVVASNALACGDSLYRVGKGVAYRVYTAPLPGNVLVYGVSESARQLAQALAETGHGVRFVDNEAELGNELGTGAYDVVIATYGDHGAVEASTRDKVKTSYLPVALTRQEAELASLSYTNVMVAERDEIKHYLKAIHNTLKNRT